MNPRSLWKAARTRAGLHLRGPELAEKVRSGEAEQRRLQREISRQASEAKRLARQIDKLQHAYDDRMRKYTALVGEYKAMRTKSKTNISAANKETRRAEKRRQELALLLKAISRQTAFKYGSYTPGVRAWDEKWQTAESRILFFAPKDYSGSLVRWGEALNRHSRHAARVVVLRGHPFGYDNDLILPHPSVAKSDLAALADEADVIHLKDEEGLFEGKNADFYDAIKRADKPIVFTHYGGYARKYKDDAQYQAHVGSFAARVAMTPDICYSWFKGAFIPHTIDSDRVGYAWRDGRVVAHSPSKEVRKGTADFLAAVEGLGLDVDLITGVPHDECLGRKRLCALFFDQAGREQTGKIGVDDVIGWYGNSALESAAYGIPTVAHLSEEAFERAEAAGCPIRDACAILNTPLGAEGIRETIRAFFALSEQGRREVSLRTRKWIEDFHGFRVVAGRLDDLYKPLL